MGVGLLWGTDVVYSISVRLGGSNFGPVWFALTALQMTLIVVVVAIGLKLLRAREAALISEFLKGEEAAARRAQR